MYDSWKIQCVAIFVIGLMFDFWAINCPDLLHMGFGSTLVFSFCWTNWNAHQRDGRHRPMQLNIAHLGFKLLIFIRQLICYILYSVFKLIIFWIETLIFNSFSYHRANYRARFLVEGACWWRWDWVFLTSFSKKSIVTRMIIIPKLLPINKNVRYKF
jgi:hypothetical protein